VILDRSRGPSSRMPDRTNSSWISAELARAPFRRNEALKKSEKFSAVTSMLGQHIDPVFRIGAAYRGFVIANQEPLRRIAANTTQLRWKLPHVDRIVECGAQELSDFDRSTPRAQKHKM
jgi:hypothetical protein